jgi:hypothetical protein
MYWYLDSKVEMLHMHRPYEPNLSMWLASRTPGDACLAKEKKALLDS